MVCLKCRGMRTLTGTSWYSAVCCWLIVVFASASEFEYEREGRMMSDYSEFEVLLSE